MAFFVHFDTTRGFEQLERAQLQDVAGLILGLFEEERERFALLTVENAAWDDAWEYMRGERSDFYDRHMTPTSLRHLGIHAAAFHAPSGEVKAEAAHDQTADAIIPLTEEMRAAGREAVLALADGQRPCVAGFRLLAGTPSLVAAAQILRSDGAGPSPGVLVFFRRLDEGDVVRLSRLARAPLALLPPAAPLAEENGEAEGGASVRIESAELAMVQVSLPDERDDPGLTLEIRAARPVFRQGRRASGQFLTWLSGSALLLSGLAILLTDRLALRRLSRLSEQAARIAGSGDLTVRLGPQGEDEIGHLAGSLDAMLDSLARAESERRRTEDFYRTVVQDHAELIVRSLPDGGMTFVNEAICRCLGRPKEDLLGRRLVDFLPPEDGRRVWETVTALSPEAPVCVIEHALQDRQGRTRWIKSTFRAFFDDAGRQTGRQGVGADVTDLKRVEADLRRANEELEQRVAERTAALALANDRLRRQAGKLLQGRLAAERAAKAKGEFLATMSHEIRTPMSGVIGMLDLALSLAPPPEIKDCLGLARTSAGALLAIVNDILDFSKIESGRLTLERQPFHLPALMESVGATLAVAARAKGLRLSAAVDEGTPVWLTGDEGRLRQVLVNVAGNAVKYTERGEVELRAGVCPRSVPAEGETVLLFTVRDTGVGIPADKLETIFESFAQLGEGSRAQAGGTGLGLAISRRLATLMGGSIEVTSQIGQGSVFSIRIRLPQARPAQAPPAPPPADAAPAALRLLVVDDNLISQTLVRGLLERRGHFVEVAANGREALDALASARYDAVFMDASMPVLGGEETVRLIRHAPPPGVNPRLPIIALTAHTLQEDRERFLAAGVDGYLTKPIDPMELDHVLRRISAAHRLS